MNKYQDMKVFTAVADSGSFVGASSALGLSKAAVSRQISELEGRLGVRLMHRTTRRLSLTPEGEIFLLRCRDILASITESEDEIASRGTAASGALRVTAPVSYGIRHLAPLWNGFLDAYPQVTLELELSDRAVNLVEEGFDLAIRIGQLNDSSLVSRQLASTRLVLCASPNYLRRRGVPRHPAELVNHETFSYSLLSTGHTWRFDGPEGGVDVRVMPRMTSNNGDTGVEVCIQGGGIHLWPTFLVEEQLKKGELVEVLPDFRASTFGIYAVYPSRKHVPAKVRALVDFLLTRLKAESPGTQAPGHPVRRRGKTSLTTQTKASR
jgi:DNA-binding transcriptional LysR family regulator